MFKDTLTQSIAEAAKKCMDEELKGNQHKIDANKNGKIDAEDFKKLRNEDMQKADVPAYLRKQKGEKPLSVADVKGPRPDSISSKESLAKARNEEVEDLDEGAFKRIATDKEEDARLSEPPFDKPYTTSKGTVTDKSGAKHSPMSRARDLARQAVKKQSEYAKARKAGSSTKNAQARAAGANNPHMFEARKAEIVKDIVKSAKKKKEDSESFQKDPELGSTITKNVC